MEPDLSRVVQRGIAGASRAGLYHRLRLDAVLVLGEVDISVGSMMGVLAAAMGAMASTLGGICPRRRHG